MKKFLVFIFSVFFCQTVVALESIDAIEESPKNIPLTNFAAVSRARVENTSSRDYQATRSVDEYNYTTLQANLNTDIIYKKNWRFESWFRLDEVNQLRNVADANSGDDRAYENLGLYVRELKLGYVDENFSFYAGKFRPHFGMAWSVGRGIWGNQFALNYQQLEKIGLSTYLRAGDLAKTGRYEFGVSFFTNDRKNLDNSLINKRDSDRKNQGLPADTRNLDSYVASLDVAFDFARDEKLFYRFSYQNLAVNSLASTVDSNKIGDQKGYSALINYQYPINSNLNLNGLAEYVYLKNVGGNSDITDKYLSSSLVANFFKNWNATLIYNAQQHFHLDQNGYDRNLTEISGGYSFFGNKLFDKLLFQVAYRNMRTNNKTAAAGGLDTKNSYGILVRYIKDF